MREVLWPCSSLLAPRGGRYSGVVVDVGLLPRSRLFVPGSPRALRLNERTRALDNISVSTLTQASLVLALVTARVLRPSRAA
jgi:hypothetical protein